MINLKTSLYDFFGYFFPGTIFLLILCLISFLLFPNNIDLNEIYNSVQNWNVIFIIGFIIISYCCGHITSAGSKIVFEKTKLNSMFRKKSVEQIKAALEDKLLIALPDNIMFKNKDDSFYYMICYVRKNNPDVYDTAFVFLSLYGLCRNLTFDFLLFIPILLILLKSFSIVSIIIILLILLLIIALLFFQYLRFYDYYQKYIMIGYIQSK